MQNVMKKIAASSLMILRALGSLFLYLIPCNTCVGLKKITRAAAMSPMRANIKSTKCHVKQPRRLFVDTPNTPAATANPPTITKSHPILLGWCSRENMMTIAAIPPITAARFNTKSRPVEINAKCPLNDRPAIVIVLACVCMNHLPCMTHNILDLGPI